MLPWNRRQHPDDEAAMLERVRLNETVTQIAFLGRRRRVYSRIVVLSGVEPGDHVLDVGCGGGYLARLLAAAVTPGGRVCGVDPAKPAIRYADRKGPQVCSFAVGTAEDLPWPDRSFDVITSTLAIHHIAQTSRPAAIGEMYRVLRPSGRLLIADFRPSEQHLRLHPDGHGMRHGAIPLADLARAAGFHIGANGDLPLLKYVQAVRPPDTSNENTED